MYFSAAINNLIQNVFILYCLYIYVYRYLHCLYSVGYFAAEIWKCHRVVTIFCVIDAAQPFSLFAITDMIFDDVFTSLSSYHSRGRTFRFSIFTNLISRARTPLQFVPHLCATDTSSRHRYLLSEFCGAASRKQEEDEEGRRSLGEGKEDSLTDAGLSAESISRRY